MIRKLILDESTRYLRVGFKAAFAIVALCALVLGVQSTFPTARLDAVAQRIATSAPSRVVAEAVVVAAPAVVRGEGVH